LPETARPVVLGAAHIPGYDIVGVLGRGGMGIVYKAWHLQLKRLVALKMILPECDTRSDLLQRFQTEAEASARLHHPHIVQVYEVGEVAGRPYMSLEYVDGGGLDRKLDGTPQPPRHAAAFVEALALAIHRAHLCGIIHRDLKPANVLLQKVGVSSDELCGTPETASAPASSPLAPHAFSPKITDFGLAKLFVGVGDARTQSGAVLGTPSYMAPEQAAGQTLKIGPATDVYSLGAILYELLTGRPPFKGETPLDTLRMVLSEEPVPVARLQPKVPRDLETICIHCLAKEPAQRYASALALAEDLQRFEANRSIQVRPASRREYAWRWCKRNPGMAVLTSLTGLLLLVIAIGALVGNALLASRLQRAERAEREAQDSEREAQKQLWTIQLEKARAVRFSQKQGQRFVALQAISEGVALARKLQLGPDAFAQMRTEAIACLALADMRLVKQWVGWPVGTRQVVFDDALELYARRDRQGSISVRRVADDSEVRLLPGPGEGPELFVLRFSPDSRYLAATCSPGQVLKVWLLARPEPIFTGKADSVAGCVDFSSDSRQCAFSYSDGSLLLVDLQTGTTRPLLPPGADCRCIAIHPSGQQLAVSTRVAGESVVQVRDVDSGEVIAQLPHPKRVDCLVWHPQGNALAATSDDHRIYLWAPPAGECIGVLEGHKEGGIQVAFNPTGDLLVSNGWDGIQRLWDFHSCRQLFSMPNGLGDQRFSRDGRRLAHLKEKNLGIVEIADGAEYRTLVASPTQGRKGYQDPVIDPSGRLLAVGMNDGTRLWELASGRELALLPTGFTPNALFQPSGNLLTSSHSSGVQRWPIQPISKSAGVYRIGPPQQLFTGATERVAQSRDGLTLAVNPAGRGARILHLEQSAGATPLLPHDRAVFLALSSDGQWVVTSTHNGKGSKVWSTGNNQLELDLPIEGSGPVAFSPDGGWLAASTYAECRLWSVGVWSQKLSIPASRRIAAFAPDSQLVAMESDAGVITLVELKTGQAVATLGSPNQDRVTMIGFSPDGTRLVTTNNDSASIHIWDLSRIRAQLVTLGLDWDRPPYPVIQENASAPPMEFQVVEK
jgi:serine/threonine protein kinase/WD40 repeat protein